MPRISKVNIGETFNSWTILKDLGIKRLEGNKNKYHYILARCECGTEREILYSCVTSGHSKSCGCHNKRVTKERMKTHGLSNTRIYRIWKDMRRRCNNPNRKNYEYYGGRGICVCSEWDNFMSFYEWSLENGYSETLSIDRIDVDGDYSPDNCRWANSKTQNRNTRKNKDFKAVSPDGSVYIDNSQAQFASDNDLDRAYINSCLVGKQNTYKGWTFEYIDE